jgi:hypothetical protein
MIDFKGFLYCINYFFEAFLVTQTRSLISNCFCHLFIYFIYVLIYFIYLFIYLCILFIYLFICLFIYLFMVSLTTRAVT